MLDKVGGTLAELTEEEVADVIADIIEEGLLLNEDIDEDFVYAFSKRFGGPQAKNSLDLDANNLATPCQAIVTMAKLGIAGKMNQATGACVMGCIDLACKKSTELGVDLPDDFELL